MPLFDSRGLGPIVVVVELLAVVALVFAVLAGSNGHPTPLLPNSWARTSHPWLKLIIPKSLWLRCSLRTGVRSAR